MRISMSDIGNLSHLKTQDSEARRRYEDDEDLVIDRNPFRQDVDMKIAASKGLRQLMFKTQVMTSPLNGLVRNRASHTIEVVSIARTIADILGLNVDLAGAIAEGHDIGHVPFGHVGEEFLSQCLGKPFRHEVFGVIRAQKIERLGKGLNLTYQTLMGILQHSCGAGEITVKSSMSPEAAVVMFADKISYILSDYNDIIKRGGLPEKETRTVTILLNQLGKNQRERANILILALCRESVLAGQVSFATCPEALIFQAAKTEMYKLYKIVNAQGVEEAMSKVYHYVSRIGDINPALLLALMNDKDILFMSEKTILDWDVFKQTSVYEQLSYARCLDPNMDLTDPDMNW